MKRILLTGGSGFVGRNLKEALAGRYEIYAPPHAELDLLDYTAVAGYTDRHRIDAVIHAAVHVPMFNGPEKEFFNDMQMFANLQKLSAQVEKVLYFGSGAEFDKRRRIRMVEEEDFGAAIPASEYGLAKYTMNLLARGSSNIYNLRLFGIFGKYELWQIKFLSNLCCKAVFGLPLTVRRDCYFDFLSVEDLPAIVSWFLENTPAWHDYNVCLGQEYQLSELAEMVRRISGKPLDITLLSPERNLDYSASNRRLRAQIPDLRLTSMEQALQQLYGYYQAHKGEIDFAALQSSR